MGVEGGGVGGEQGGGGGGGQGEQGGGGAGLTRAAGAARDPGRCYRPAGGHMTVPRILEADSCTNTNTNTNSTNNYDNDNVGRGFNLIVIGFLGSEGISKSQGLRFAELQACPGGREGLRWQQQQKVEEEEEEEGWLAVEALEAAASLLGVETVLCWLFSLSASSNHSACNQASVSHPTLKFDLRAADQEDQEHHHGLLLLRPRQPGKCQDVAQVGSS